MNKVSYNKIAGQWAQSRNQSTISQLVQQFAQLLKPGGTVLDVGCGTGVPIANYLQDSGFQVTGIDASEKMIELAEQQVPNATFLVADMTEYRSAVQFDGIVAWDSLFHLASEQQRKMYPELYNLLQSGGYLLFTSGNVDGEIVGTMYGESFYYGSIETEKLKALLTATGFQILFLETDYRERDMEISLVAILKK